MVSKIMIFTSSLLWHVGGRSKWGWDSRLRMGVKLEGHRVSGMKVCFCFFASGDYVYVLTLWQFIH